MSNQGLPARIKEARLAAGMRPENLAVELGISYNTVRNWEMGRTTPTIGFASRLATALNVELLWLIEGDREEVVA